MSLVKSSHMTYLYRGGLSERTGMIESSGMDLFWVLALNDMHMSPCVLWFPNTIPWCVCVWVCVSTLETHSRQDLEQ